MGLVRTVRALLNLSYSDSKFGVQHARECRVWEEKVHADIKLRRLSRYVHFRGCFDRALIHEC
jgi:hypothetical protein